MDFSIQSLDDGPDSSTDPFYKYLPLYQVRDRQLTVTEECFMAALPLIDADKSRADGAGVGFVLSM